MNNNSSTGGKLSVNVGKIERVASILAGTVLLYKGFKSKKSALKVPAIVAGGFLWFRGATAHCPVYSALGKNKLQDTVRNINIRTMVTVNRPRNEVYAFWRQLSNLPLFMEHLKSVEVLDGKRSLWKAQLPATFGTTLQWEAEIVKEIEGEFIGWNSLPNASIQNAGKVEFRDTLNNETEIRVTISYRAPFGDIGEGIASWLNPMLESVIKKDVQNYKHYLEAGDILKSDA